MDTPTNLKDLAAFESFPGLSVRYLRENLVFPLKREDGHILLAMAQPEDQELQAAMEVALKVPVVPVKAAEAEILEFIQAAYEPGGPMSRLVGDLEAEELDVESEETAEIGHLRDMAREAPIIQLVNLLVLRAIQMGASDIHLEPFEDAFRVRYRKDGILYEAESPPKGLTGCGPLPLEDHGAPGYCRAPAAAGRPLPPEGAGARYRFPGVHPAHAHG